MKREVARRTVQKVTIKSPCSVGWDTMEGDDKVRFCGQCKLNVYNISGMSEAEAANVLTRSDERPCVFLRRTEDGIIVSDNCPVALRSMRKRLVLSTVLVALTMTYGLTLSAQGQGIAVSSLVVDPRYGQVHEIGQLADYGYDSARAISRAVTALAFVICCFVPMDKRITAKRALIELLALACVPVLAHLIGTYMINNFGGLGGGGI
jgi:hypothetical protein